MSGAITVTPEQLKSQAKVYQSETSLFPMLGVNLIV